MRAAEPLQPDLRPEWERIERLAACLEALRRGETVAETRLGDFERICAEVRAVREAGGWADLVPLLSPKAAAEIGHHDLDILACVLAPEAVGRLAWTYQRLQPGITEPYPTRALLHDLLMLDTDEDQAFFARLCPTSPLFAGRLIMVEGEGPMQILRPSAALIERVLRRAARFGPPPGATTVPGGSTGMIWSCRRCRAGSCRSSCSGSATASGSAANGAAACRAGRSPCSPAPRAPARRSPRRSSPRTSAGRSTASISATW